MQISEQIRTYRKAANLTQEQLAHDLGISAPAVSKWERGAALPDVALLPALARLLGVDLNTLFSFHETLTDVEAAAFSRELALLSQSDPHRAFAMAVQKLREYPKSDNLLLSAANILNAALILSPMEAEKKRQYEELILQWLERAAESADEDIRTAAATVLLGKAMEAGDYDRAEALLERLPKQQFDRAAYEANILLHQGKPDEAAVLLESRLLQALSSVQTYCLKLLDVELGCGRPERARQIGAIIEKMVPLFGLWQYGAVVPRLQIALHEKDEQASLTAVRDLMAAANTPWVASDSPVLGRIAHGAAQDVGKPFLPALLSELKTGPEYDFLRDHPAFQAFLKELEEAPSA